MVSGRAIKNTVIRDEDSLRLVSSQPFCLESDGAAVSVDIHGGAGSSWHLIQDFTDVACDLNGTFFIHQNKGMFQKFFILWPFGFILCKAQVDKVNETRRELSFLRITQLWGISFYDLCQLIKYTIPLWIWKPAGGQFVQCDP